MPILNMQVPVDADNYYQGETLARNEGVSLYDKFSEWLGEYLEDAQDAADLEEAIKQDDGTRYTSSELREELGL